MQTYNEAYLTLAYKIKRKWENQAKKAELRVVKSKNETECKTERLQINMDKTTSFQIIINIIHKL